MAGKREEAFIMAQSHNEIDKYAEVIGKMDDRNTEEHLRIAQVYEGKNQWGRRPGITTSARTQPRP